MTGITVKHCQALTTFQIVKCSYIFEPTLSLLCKMKAGLKTLVQNGAMVQWQTISTSKLFDQRRQHGRDALWHMFSLHWSRLDSRSSQFTHLRTSWVWEENSLWDKHFEYCNCAHPICSFASHETRGPFLGPRPNENQYLR